jgi:creatinine amidohydrolase
MNAFISREASSFAWMTSPEAGRLATEQGRRPVALLPTGAVEQHGPHLPMGLDIWLAHAVALKAAEGQDGIRVCEPFAYGSSQHHRALYHRHSSRFWSIFVHASGRTAFCR